MTKSAPWDTSLRGVGAFGEMAIVYDYFFYRRVPGTVITIPSASDPVYYKSSPGLPDELYFGNSYRIINDISAEMSLDF